MARQVIKKCYTGNIIDEVSQIFDRYCKKFRETEGEEEEFVFRVEYSHPRRPSASTREAHERVEGPALRGGHRQLVPERGAPIAPVSDP